MMLTIEKVAVLNQIDFFAGTPDYILAAVAGIAEEVNVLAGEIFIREGDVEDSFYVIVQGEVRVFRGERTIITLHSGDSVGELAVLDPEPRSASAAALQDTLLFRLDKEPFDEVMADRPEIAQGVIRALTRRIREQGRQMSQAT